jgi:hypothetical protein
LDYLPPGFWRFRCRYVVATVIMKTTNYIPRKIGKIMSEYKVNRASIANINLGLLSIFITSSTTSRLHSFSSSHKYFCPSTATLYNPRRSLGRSRCRSSHRSRNRFVHLADRRFRALCLVFLIQATISPSNKHDHRSNNEQ